MKMFAFKLNSRRQASTIIALTVAAVAVFWLFSLTAYSSLRAAHFAQATADAQKAASAFEDHANRLLDYGDTHLRSIRSFYLAQGGGDALRRHVADIRTPDDDRFTSILFLTDKAGRIIFHSLSSGIGADISHLDYFTLLRDSAGDEVYVDPTRPGVVSGQMQFRIVRKIMRNGVFDGVIGLALLPGSMVAYYKALDLGPHSSLMMVKTDHQIIVREPLPSADIYPRKLEADSLWAHLRQQPSGFFRTDSVIDGVRRIVAYRLLEHYPVTVDVGVAEQDVLDSLRDVRFDMVVQCLLFTVVAGLFCALVLVILQKKQILAEKTRQLALSNADLERFAYVASHDLQTPLRTIGSYAQLLERRYGDRLDADAHEFIGYLVDAAQHLSGLITDLLNYARVSSPGRPLTQVAMGRAFGRAVANLKAGIDEAGAVVRADALPDIVAEESQAVSLFQNLIENALKFRHPDRAPMITVNAWPLSSLQWCFAVEDNGVGIDPEYFEKIFVIFQRLRPNNTAGTGIGLALCQRIVRRFGGDIWVESTPGQGATFYFTAPNPAARPLCANVLATQ